ncbi:hypothetical protein CAPTEDRAFT_186105 [Capitella teleta]|uniref:CARD domain-containing protein n=1 Tax=Capitella teleta TaxID=283909 RepID=R7TNT0_CAPTE|nr:hypothetical protein CAPTEDRAFT_186105 [Capitella teleta]|eukprot:ELT95533.1 hypothetical protein CAPTEDRAFT_186105 [Capitella teleta]
MDEQADVADWLLSLLPVDIPGSDMYFWNDMSGYQQDSFVLVTLSVYHAPGSNASAFNVSVQEGSQWTDIYWGELQGVSLGDSNFTVRDDRYFTWENPQLDVGDFMNVSYVFDVINDGDFLMDNENVYIPTFAYYYDGNLGSYSSAFESPCIKKNEEANDSLVTNYGYTVLALVIAFLIGAVLVLLVLFIIYKIRRQMPFTSGSVKPATVIDHGTLNSKMTWSEQKSLAKNSQGLVMDPKSAPKMSLQSETKEDISSSGESFVFILTLKDKLKMLREIDSQDIQSTIRADRDIEAERNDAMTDATLLLVQNLKENGDIPKSAEEKNTSQFKNDIAKLDKDMDLSLKNKEKLSALMEKQVGDRENLNDKMRNMTDEEKEDVKKLFDDEQETERSELTYRLKLEQEEETEKLRKEFSIRKRMGIKGKQQDYLDGVRKDAQLSEEQADWMMNEHIKNQSAVDKLYDDEISRQRMVLEEKLARRRALAEAKELQEDSDSEILNAMAGHQMQLLQKAKKQSILREDEAQKMIDAAQEQLVKTKERLDADRQKQEAALHKKLSDRKKQKMQEQAKVHKKEIAEFNHQKDASTDPIAFVQERQAILSKQRTEKTEMENEIDMEHASELDQLRKNIVEQGKELLEDGKDKLNKELSAKGLDLDKMLKKHKKELDNLNEIQGDEKKKQLDNFKKRLVKNRKDWAQRRKEEEEEQDQLRDHEEKVVRQMMDNQVAISEDERQKIMQEHEKQMVQLENNLTLSKLQQKRLLEEKIARKREIQMEKLEVKQMKESKKQQRQDDSDEDTAAENEVNLLKKHAEQRIAILQGEKLNLEEEMDEIQEEMMKGRAEALKEQEVQLANMMMKLQLEKAKEMARIEEQQKAIHNLKSNLMDDLNEKGILSDPECQRVIEIHQQEQEKLNNKLDSQRDKQEKILQKKLQERLQQKEHHLQRMHDQQLQEVAQGAQGLGAKLRRAALVTKHLLEKENFSNRMQKEINQTLEELRRQQEMRRIELAQDQEIQFINGLVRLGKFSPDELDQVVAMLFPTKTNEERKNLLTKLTEGYEAPSPSKDTKPKFAKRRTLEARVFNAAISGIELDGFQKKASGKRRKPSNNSFPSTEGRLPPSRLPPMEKPKKKKKQRNPVHDDYDS